MKNLILPHKTLNIQNRFFISYLFLDILIIAIFTVFFYTYTSDILIQRETDSMKQQVTSFLTQTDLTIKEMDNTSTSIVYSSLIQQKISDYFAPEYQPQKSDTDAIIDLFIAINGPSFAVQQINFYDFTGKYVCAGLQNKPGYTDLSLKSWYQESLAQNGKKCISSPYSASFIPSSNKLKSYISLCRVHFNRSGKAIGIVETIQESDKIFDHLRNYENNTLNATATYVYNENGTLMYPYITDKDIEQKAAYYYDTLKAAPKHNSITYELTHPTTKDTDWITSQRSDYTHWTFVTVKPESDILSPVATFSKLLLAVVLFILILSIILSYSMAKSLTNPIKKIRRIIRKTELTSLGTASAIPFDTSVNELEELNLAFQKMSFKLKNSFDELMDAKQQELKSRSLALQSQINPHFYYNSLSSISILAEMGQSDDVVHLCQNLSYIMRYITTDQASLVTLETEISYVSKYLYCMKVRYQSSLNYTIDIDPELMNRLVPKLIVQPLVENALKYGTNCDPPWNITIIGKMYEDCWRIDVTDTGNGFTADAMELLKKRIHDTNHLTGVPDIQLDGMGLMNVYSRWKLNCTKETMIFDYHNSLTGGAVISIGEKFNCNGGEE